MRSFFDAARNCGAGLKSSERRPQAAVVAVVVVVVVVVVLGGRIWSSKLSLVVLESVFG